MSKGKVRVPGEDTGGMWPFLSLMARMMHVISSSTDACSRALRSARAAESMQMLGLQCESVWVGADQGGCEGAA